MNAKIHTDHGTMTVEFFEKDAPNTVANFVKLAKEGFYEGLKFHRVIPGFVAQGGCPQGIGSGGPGYTIDCELDGENQFHDKGVLSMAHAGRNTGGSQFFIVHNRENTAHLDRNHTCFGKVTEGLDLVEKINQGDTFRVEVLRTEARFFNAPQTMNATTRAASRAALVCARWGTAVVGNGICQSFFSRRPSL